MSHKDAPDHVPSIVVYRKTLHDRLDVMEDVLIDGVRWPITGIGWKAAFHEAAEVKITVVCPVEFRAIKED